MTTIQGIQADRLWSSSGDETGQKLLAAGEVLRAPTPGGPAIRLDHDDRGPLVLHGRDVNVSFLAKTHGQRIRLLRGRRRPERSSYRLDKCRNRQRHTSRQVEKGQGARQRLGGLYPVLSIPMYDPTRSPLACFSERDAGRDRRDRVHHQRGGRHLSDSLHPPQRHEAP